MKKCPTCQKTFDDNLRFCQLDGTLLVEDAPAFDPYATIVSGGMAPPAPSEPEPRDSGPAEQIDAPDQILDIPNTDPLKTMYASDAEMKEILGGEEPIGAVDAADQKDTAKSLPASADPETSGQSPREPAQTPSGFPTSEPPVPGQGDSAPPPSPFSGDETIVDIPPAAPPPKFDEPSSSSFAGSAGFDEAATILQPKMGGAFNPEPPAAPVAEWTPPTAPNANWQNQQVGSNAPLQPPPSGIEGQSQVLAIVSLVCGILSLLCCNWFVVGIAAVITGFIARSKAHSDPAHFGGEGLALGGIITGGISMVLGIIVWILYFLGFMASLLTAN